MVDAKNVHEQLKQLKFGSSPFNQAEVRELPHILHEGEKILELVNGFYEGGVALLVATDMRVLLIDKKPLNYLTVEDLRFDMINEIDYSHRLMGATITISTGSKTLKFNSYNQSRLRKLITLVQERMSLIKKEQNDKADNQQQHLEEINKQLQMYLLATHQQLQSQASNQVVSGSPELPKPDPQLSDYLFAQRLLEEFKKQNAATTPMLAPTSETPPPADTSQQQAAPAVLPPVISEQSAPEAPAPTIPPAELVADAKREIFSRQMEHQAPDPVQQSASPQAAQATSIAANQPGFIRALEISPLSIAYSKLPMMLRNRKFGRPSLHAHSQQQVMPTGGYVNPSPST